MQTSGATSLPAHLPRVDQRVEPEDTCCPTPECGQPMVRVGEDISERLDLQQYGYAIRFLYGTVLAWTAKRSTILLRDCRSAEPSARDRQMGGRRLR